MTLTNEDLLALSQMMDAKLQPIEKKLDRIEEKVDRLEVRVSALEESVSRLEVRVSALEESVSRLEVRVSALETDMVYVKKHLKRIEVCMETNILPRLANIEDCYLDTFGRYQESADKTDAVCGDVELLKKVVSEHSEKLKHIKVM